MPDKHFDPSPYAGSDWSLLEHLIAGGFSMLFWLAVLGTIVWAVWHYTRQINAAQPAALLDEPSAMELLRRRYALGEIDVETFETMTERLLVSEERERTHVPQGRRYEHPLL